MQILSFVLSICCSKAASAKFNTTGKVNKLIYYLCPWMGNCITEAISSSTVFPTIVDKNQESLVVLLAGKSISTIISEDPKCLYSVMLFLLDNICAINLNCKFNKLLKTLKWILKYLRGGEKKKRHVLILPGLENPGHGFEKGHLFLSNYLGEHICSTKKCLNASMLKRRQCSFWEG